MKCNRCGAYIYLGEDVCSRCGSNEFVPTTEEQTPDCAGETVAVQALVKSTPPRSGAPKIRFTRKHIWIASIVAVLCVFVASVCISPVLKNFFLRLILSPKAYMCYVVKTNASDFAEDFSEFIVSAKENIDSNVTNDGSAEFVRSKNRSGLENYIIKKVIGEFDSIGVDYVASKKNKDISADATFRINGEDILDIQLLADKDDDSQYLGLSEINESHILYPDKNSAEDSESKEAEDAILDKIIKSLVKESVYDTYRDIVAVCPEKKELKKIMLKYAIAVFFELDDVTETKSSCTADGIAKEYIDLTLTIDEETAINVSSEVIKLLKEDEKVKRIILDAQERNPAKKGEKSLYDRFYESLENAENKLKNAKDGEILEDDIVLNIRVDRKGKIKGISLASGDNNVEYYVVKEGKKTAMYACIKWAKIDRVIEGSYTENKNKLSGRYVIKSPDYGDIKITLEDINSELLKKGIFNGRLKVDAKDIYTVKLGFKNMTLSKCTIEIDSQATESKTIDVDYRIVVSTKEKSEVIFDGSVTSSENSDIEYADESIKENAVEKKEWLEKVNFEPLYDRLGEAGINEKTADVVIGLIVKKTAAKLSE